MKTSIDQSLKISNFFQVPLVPFLPYCSIVVNIILMLKLNTLTWIRFGVWLVIGMLGSLIML